MSHQSVDGPKIVIVGAGSVGTTFAYSLLIRGLASQIAIIDVNARAGES